MQMESLNWGRNEQQRIACLCRVLTCQLHALADGQSPDYEMMLQVVDYIRTPASETRVAPDSLTVRSISARHRDVDSAAVKLLNLQRQVWCHGAALAEMIERILDGHLISRSALVNTGNVLIERCHDLMRRERTARVGSVEQDRARPDGRGDKPGSARDFALAGHPPAYSILMDRLLAQSGGTRPWDNDGAERCPVCSQQ